MLGGGGALGAFQPGVYEALHEAGLEPDRLVGSSIGALNGALIAGNPPERRLERLRAFWDMVAEPGLSPAAWTGDRRRAIKAAAAVRVRLLGRPGLYRPHLPRLFLQTPAWGKSFPVSTRPGARDPSPAGRLRAHRRWRPDLVANLTDLETGASVVVDSAAVRLRPEHLIASMGLLPDFPPTKIDGRWFCDGGFSANLPVHQVLDPPPERDVVCIAVDLLGEPGSPVFSVDGMMERSNDLLFANQTRAALATFEARYATRNEGGSVLLLLIACNGEGERVGQKSWDYGRGSIHERWRAGYEACRAALAPLRELPIPAAGRLEIHRLAVPSAVSD